MGIHGNPHLLGGAVNRGVPCGWGPRGARISGGGSGLPRSGRVRPDRVGSAGCGNPKRVWDGRGGWIPGSLGPRAGAAGGAGGPLGRAAPARVWTLCSSFSRREAPKASAARLRMSPKSRGKTRFRAREEAASAGHRFLLPSAWMERCLARPPWRGWGRRRGVPGGEGSSARTRPRPASLAVSCQGGRPPAGTSVLGIVTVPQS